jgi:hypothetical protein
MPKHQIDKSMLTVDEKNEKINVVTVVSHFFHKISLYQLLSKFEPFD